MERQNSVNTHKILRKAEIMKSAESREHTWERDCTEPGDLRLNVHVTCYTGAERATIVAHMSVTMNHEN